MAENIDRELGTISVRLDKLEESGAERGKAIDAMTLQMADVQRSVKEIPCLLADVQKMLTYFERGFGGFRFAVILGGISMFIVTFADKLGLSKLWGK